jgi:hypothetical protein
MHRDPKQWAYVRRLILEKGASRRGVSRKMGLSRNTVRKMLACPHPPRKATSLNGAEGKLFEAARSLAAERHSIDPTAYRRRALYLWGRTRDIILKLDRPRGAALLRETAEMINGASGGGEHAFLSARRYALERGDGSRVAGQFAARRNADC